MPDAFSRQTSAVASSGFAFNAITATSRTRPRTGRRPCGVGRGAGRGDRGHRAVRGLSRGRPPIDGESVPYVAGWGEGGALDAVRGFAETLDALARRLDETLISPAGDTRASR